MPDNSPSLGQIGFAGRAVLYATTGFLAGRIAVGLPGDAGAQGAMQQLGQLPFGMVLLGILSLTLAVFAFWAGVQAIGGDDGELDVMHRLGRGVQALFYGGLAVLAAKQVFAGGSSGGGGSQSALTATVMENPVGRAAIGIAGVVFVVVGIRQLWRAWNGDLREELDGIGHPSWARAVGRLGYAGRGLSYLLIGAFVTHGAVVFDPDEATGLDKALDELSRTVPGRVAVAVVALGLVTLAVWFGLVARHGVRDEVDATPEPANG
ncbi:DUF1206 domain-containing protein [Euzebya rosea]|uniref:DUF1206 domain-containing protein n=1 Tax=Euzebya rosea TaxID=2052804 RepID=UPI000D3E0A39|nr:DUF1206 domain-containing protein [Euzebya rosea]